MAFPQGIDFRASSGFATDPTNCTFETGDVNTDYPTLTPQGNNVGWETGYVGGQGRDRLATLDPRITGINFVNVAQATFRIDLPAPGQYSLNLAIGDTLSRDSLRVEVFDNASSLLVVSGSNFTLGGAGWLDATGTGFVTPPTNTDAELIAASSAWAVANPQGGGGVGAVTLTFASTIARFTLGEGSTISGLAHIWMQGESASPGPSNVYFDIIF